MIGQHQPAFVTQPEPVEGQPVRVAIGQYLVAECRPVALIDKDALGRRGAGPFGKEGEAFKGTTGKPVSFAEFAFMSFSKVELSGLGFRPLHPFPDGANHFAVLARSVEPGLICEPRLNIGGEADRQLLHFAHSIHHSESLHL